MDWNIWYFLFLISSAELGGFKGRIGQELLFTVIYPALLWFLSMIAENHRWAKISIVCLSALGTVIAGFIFVALIIFKQVVIASVVCFLILNVGVFVLARKKVVSIYE